jgi:peptidyl-prolyl cis-trans isomerase-like 4
MSVLLETSLGDLVVDLDVEQCPNTCKNFLKLCKTYKYNYLTFFSVQKNFLAQSGDPTNTGKGGQSIWSQLDPSSDTYSSVPYFFPERHPSRKHARRGTLSMACRRLRPEDEDSLVAGSQFFVTLSDDIEYLDDKHAPFGRVVEGDEKDGTLDKINAAFVDKDMRPLQDIRIQQVVVLDDPFEDPQGLHVPSRTPSPTPEQMAAIGLDATAPLNDDENRPTEEVEEEKRRKDQEAAALTLEMVGDLPFAEIRPPENILFVCKLNPVTRSEDLELIFSRFGKILSCEVIKEKKTGDSLQYAFIEFDQRKSAEQAYFKMQNVLVDDRRIWVDFSQSVSKLTNNWNSSRSQGKVLKVKQGSRDSQHDSRGNHEYSQGSTNSRLHHSGSGNAYEIS